MSFLANIMCYWMEPCIDTTGDAIEILRMYDEPIESPEEIVDFHKSLECEGGYQLAERKTRVILPAKRKIRSYLPTIYSNSYAIKFNELSNSNWGIEFIDSETKNEIRGYIDRCEVLYKDRLGFRERPGLKNYNIPLELSLKMAKLPKAPPEIFTTHNAVLFLTDDGGIGKENIPKILNFIDAHLEGFETEYGTGAGFKNAMIEKPKIPITSYALDTYRRLTSKKEFENYLGENNLRDKIINFLSSNWVEVENGGGFGVSNIFIPYHTRHALNILDNLGADLGSLRLTSKIRKKPLEKEKIEEKIAKGVENCFVSKNEKGHYGAFGMDSEREPTIFGTIEALRIFEILDRKDLMEKYRDDVLNFVKSYRKNGGYVGYIYHWYHWGE